MLSYMKEPDLNNSTTGDSPSANGNNGQDQQEFYTVASRSEVARRTTYLLVILFVIGFVCLWIMIQKSSPSKAAASVTTEEAQIEKALSQLTGVKTEMSNNMDEIVNKFYEFSDVKQVSVDELSKNPFKHVLYTGQIKPDPNSGIDMAMVRQELLRQQSKDLKLMGIMQSQRGNCCMIGDKVLYKGDKLQDFTVSEISEYQVKLESDGFEIVLKVSE